MLKKKEKEKKKKEKKKKEKKKKEKKKKEKKKKRKKERKKRKKRERKNQQDYLWEEESKKKSLAQFLKWNETNNWHPLKEMTNDLSPLFSLPYFHC